MIGNRTHEKSAENGGQNCTGPSSIEDDCNIQDCPGFRIFLKKYLIQPIPVHLKQNHHFTVLHLRTLYYLRCS